LLSYVVHASHASFHTLFKLKYPHFKILDLCCSCTEVFKHKIDDRKNNFTVTTVENAGAAAVVCEAENIAMNTGGIAVQNDSNCTFAVCATLPMLAAAADASYYQTKQRVRLQRLGTAAFAPPPTQLRSVTIFSQT